MSWRPEDWKKASTVAGWMAESEVYEAGADAMLEALKELGTPTGLPYTAYAKERKGYLVLIPEEK